MKKNFIYCVLLVMITANVGCSDNDEDYLENPIMQIQWEGTLSGEDMVPITIMFRNEKNGYYIINDESFGFSYHRNDRIIQISGYNGYLLNGEWYIVKLKQNDFVLKRQPLTESNSITLNLQKIN